MSLSKPAVDILLYIALSEEFDDLSDELIAELGDSFTSNELDDIAITIFSGNVSSSVLNRSFRLVVVPAGKMGINRAASLTSIILEKFSPGNVVVLGIAGSLSSDLQPGDVFIPGSVDEYLANAATKGKQKTWKFETSGNDLPTSPRLLNRFQMFRHTQKPIFDTWFKGCNDRVKPLFEGELNEVMAQKGLNFRPQVRLFAGDDRKLASGPAVGKGKAFVDWIKREVDRKLAAIEMESAGIYDAALIRTPAPRVIAIRGISDFADERKELLENVARGQFRSVSAKNALALLLRGIDAGFFEQDGVDAQTGNESSRALQPESRVSSIFVIGGITGESSDPESEKPCLHIGCYGLGQAIARARSQLILCSPFPDSADYYTAMGYAAVEGGHVIHLHRPNHPNVDEKRKLFAARLKRSDLRILDWLYPGPEKEDKEAWQQAWLLAQLQALDRANAVVAVGGKLSGTANTLLHLAEARNLPIIPFTFLGGAAQRCFERRDWDRLHPGFETSLLEQDQGVERVIEIANRFVIDLVRYKHHIEKPQTFFISRATQDSRMANDLCEWLKRQNFEVLLGDEEVRVDQMAIASIDQAVHRSDICVVFWSRHYAVSPWCYDELTLACDVQKDIWLFNLDDSLIVPRKARKLTSILARSTPEILEAAAKLLEQCKH